MDTLKKLRIAFLLLVGVLVLGVIGYISIEHWSFLDGLYMTVITISTVGFHEVRELSMAGRFFTIFLIIIGVGVLLNAFGVALEFMVEGHLSGLMGRRRMEKKIKDLKDHYILCGYGRVGQQVAKEFSAAGVTFVVVENNPEKCALCREEGLLCIEGDASSDEILEETNIRMATGLVAAVDTDADNVFVTLTARVLNPEILIVARANSEETEEKLIKAGATRVISPTAIGGRRMANLLLKPLVCDYLDFVSHGGNLEFQLEEIAIDDGSSLVGKTIRQTQLRDKAGVLILAIQREDGGLDTNPSPETFLSKKDRVVVIGTKNQLDELQKLL